MNQRLDVYLHEKGYFESRSKASAAILEGRINVGGVTVKKPSFEVGEDSVISVADGDDFVSRAYRKLSAALDSFGYAVKGAVAVDIGASTGGFTQCLLDRGVKKVYAVDVGTGQLHPRLKNDSRVVNMESTNAKNLKKSDLSDEITLAIMDVSFISQSKLYPSVSGILPENGVLISLVKPQFEVGKQNIGKNGIVKDKSGKLIASVMEFLKSSGAENNLFLEEFMTSPITGGDGNTEYLSLFIKRSNS